MSAGIESNPPAILHRISSDGWMEIYLQNIPMETNQANDNKNLKMNESIGVN